MEQNVIGGHWNVLYCCKYGEFTSWGFRCPYKTAAEKDEFFIPINLGNEILKIPQCPDDIKRDDHGGYLCWKIQDMSKVKELAKNKGKHSRHHCKPRTKKSLKDMIERNRFI